jgi:mannosyl-3-phosphoglycerate phosphatase
MSPLKRMKNSNTNFGKYKGPLPRLIIFTDLDGTLLSHDTYEPGPSLEALKLCKDFNIPVVLVSSKTRAEMERIRDQLGNRDPFVSENGGGIFVPAETWDKPEGFESSGRFWHLVRSQPHDLLSNSLDIAARHCGALIEKYSSMSLDRVMELTGLSEDEARLSQMREFDEPFLLQNQTAQIQACLERETQKKGLTLTRGGRFLHMTGGYDKGKAVHHLINLYKGSHPKLLTSAVGDAVNDLPMLKEVESPFLVRKLDGRFEKDAVFDRVIVTKGTGPHGFLEAVKSMTASPDIA